MKYNPLLITALLSESMDFRKALSKAIELGIRDKTGLTNPKDKAFLDMAYKSLNP